MALAIARSNGSTSALPRIPTWWLSPVAGFQSTMPRAQRGSRLRFAGNDVPPMIQTAWPSQWNQTGDSRGPWSEVWAKWAYNGRDRNSSRSKMAWPPAETLFSTIFIVPLLSAACAASSSRLVRSNRLFHGRPVRAQQTVDGEVVWLPTTHTKTPQATLTHKPAALEQALRPAVVHPDEGVHSIDLVPSKSPLEYCGHGLVHQPLAPVSLRQVVRQLRPAVHRGPLVETARADKLIIGLES